MQNKGFLKNDLSTLWKSYKDKVHFVGMSIPLLTKGKKILWHSLFLSNIHPASAICGVTVVLLNSLVDMKKSKP